MPKRVMIRDHITGVVSVGARVAYSLEIVVLRVGTLYVSLIITKVYLVGLFMEHFRLLIGFNPSMVITQVRVVDSL